MPYRAYGLLMALAGLVAVAGLILVGINVYAARQRGPRWKRRLLGAGLAMLGLVGAWLARPKPLVRTACYRVVLPPVTAPSLQRLEMQTSLLYRLTAEGRLDAEAARKALVAAEAALAEAATPETLKGLSPAERSRAEELLQAARTKIDELKARLDANPPAPAQSGASLEDSPDWKLITDAWAYQVGGSKESQAEGLKKLQAADAAAKRLVAAGLLTAGEAGLLAAEAEERSVPLWMATSCYYMAMPRPAQDSLERLSARLPLLRELAASGKLPRAAVDKALERMETDVWVLSQDNELSRLPADKIAEAGKTRDAARELIAGTRKLQDRLAGERELLKEYRGDVRLPEDLYQTYVRFVAACAKGDQPALAEFCAAAKIELTTAPRSEGARDRGGDLNLPFLKDRFDKRIQVVNREREIKYLIRTNTTALWWTRDRDGRWLLVQYLDKPIE